MIPAVGTGNRAASHQRFRAAIARQLGTIKKQVPGSCAERQRGRKRDEAVASPPVAAADPALSKMPALPPAVKAAVRDVCTRHALAPADVLGPRRLGPIVRARQELMWLLYDGGRRSLPAVGRLLGGKDHTTVLHGVRQHEARFGEGMAVVALAAALARLDAPAARATGGEG